jgi:hypothetical protein
VEHLVIGGLWLAWGVTQIIVVKRLGALWKQR